MTQMPENTDSPAAGSAEAERKKRATDRLVKIGFLLAVLIVGTVVWFRQGHGPQLQGWGGDLPTAIGQAKDHNRRIIVFFSQDPPSEDDRHAMDNVIRQPDMEKAVKRFGYVTVHLDTNNNSAEARKYGVSATPTYLLLDSTGKELKRTSGRMNVSTFTNTFLGVSLTTGPSQ
jgi:hypothetical protein